MKRIAGGRSTDRPRPERERGRSTAAIAGALVLLGLAAVLWFARTPPPDHTTTTGPAAGGRAAVPVIIYLIDTLRADRLHLYGYSRETSPTMDALAAESVVFDQAYAPAPWTLPSVASLVTSTFICEHGMEEPALHLDPGLGTLAERLRAAGYRTGAYYGNGLVGPQFGLDRGYEISELRSDDDIREDEARAFLDRIGPAAPFLLYLHTMEPHQPYLAPYEYIQPFGHVSIEQKVRTDNDWTEYAGLKRVGPVDRTVDLDRMARRLDENRPVYELLYDASIRQADDNLKKVIELLKARNLWDSSLFIVLADHGEEFGEHGVWLHKESVYESVMHVPLIIHFPGSEFAGRRIGEPVSLVDIAPTILDYIGQAGLCEGCRGRSLLPAVAGALRPAESAYVPGLRMNTTTYYRRVREQRGDVSVIVRQGRWKGIWNEQPGRLELYDLEADPQELADLGATAPDRAAPLRDYAAQWLAACRAALRPPQATTLDERTRQNLRALGYIN